MMHDKYNPGAVPELSEFNVRS